ncbi:hypothetical protein [Rhizobium sp. BK379]|nr:hypothetical protein [Rhizobium sp. BK379]MBB3445484.1 hypothetical protein [Rhizobium sp. BK379]
MDYQQTIHFTTSFKKYKKIYGEDFHFTLDTFLAFWRKQPLMFEHSI